MIDRNGTIKRLQDSLKVMNRWCCTDSLDDPIANIERAIEDVLELLEAQELVIRCKDCKHLFDGEHTENCCDVLMEKAGWLKEISVNPDWFCADGRR